MGRRHLYLIRRSPRRCIQIFAYLNQAFAEFTEFAHQATDTFMVLRLNIHSRRGRMLRSDGGQMSGLGKCGAATCTQEPSVQPNVLSLLCPVTASSAGRFGSPKISMTSLRLCCTS